MPTKFTSNNTQNQPAARADKDVVLAADDQQNFDRLLSLWLECAGFESETDRVKMTFVINSEWQVRHLQRQLDEAQFDTFFETPNPMDWTDEQHRKLQLISRHLSAAERTFKAAQKDLGSIRN